MKTLFVLATISLYSLLGGCWEIFLDRLDTFKPNYPLYKQCDPKWGNDTMQVKSLCDVGCLESSVSMALRGWRVPVNHKLVNPGTLNQWLRNNSGYLNATDDLVESSIPKISASGRVKWPKDGMIVGNHLKPKEIIAYLEEKRVIIAHVRNGTHFVLCVGHRWASNSELIVSVHDPGFDRLFYRYSEIVGYRIFDISPP